MCVDLERATIALKWRDSRGERLGSLAAAMDAVGRDAVFATNAGIFDSTFTPLGLHIEEQLEMRPLNRADGVGNFFWKPNAVFSIFNGRASISQSERFDLSHAYDLATQSGPMLIDSGAVLPEIAASTGSKRTRSGVGVDRRGKVIFLLSSDPCSFAEFAETFQRLGCTSAIYLDGEISRFRTLADPADGHFSAIFVARPSVQ